MSGYVAMSRDWQDHDIFEGDEFSRRDAWAWLISQAAWKPTTARVKGSKVDLGRGELTFSVRFLASKWGWSKSRVDRFISTLRDEGMIETRSKIGTTAGHAAGQGQSILTICNYEKFQDRAKGERDNSERPIGTTAGQQRDKEEPRNNTIPNGMGVPPVDPVKQLFDVGTSVLTAAGHSEREARSLVGKWRKNHSDGDVMAALVDCRTRAISNPVEWVPRRLSGTRPGDPPSYFEHLKRQRAATQ